MMKAIKTVLFMIAITFVFISALSFVNESSRERIEKNMKLQFLQSVLYAGGLLPQGVDEQALSNTSTTSDLQWDISEMLSVFQSQIHEIMLPVKDKSFTGIANVIPGGQDSVKIYVFLNDSNDVDGYGFSMYGKGLWGSIQAFGVVESNLTTMTGIDFTEQVETPGLGARITEHEFKYFFRNLDLSGFLKQNDEKPVIMVNSKAQNNLENQTNSIQSITGATQTSNGVMNMMLNNLAFYLEFIRDNEKEILSLI